MADPGEQQANRQSLYDEGLDVADRHATLSVPYDCGIAIVTSQWQGRTVVRFSVSNWATDAAHVARTSAPPGARWRKAEMQARATESAASG
jgi:hypothetical protein